MKKPTPLVIVLWIIMFVLGISTMLVGLLTTIPDYPMWMIAVALWLVDIIWVIVLFASGGKKKGPSRGRAFVGNQQIFQRVLRETEEAVARYTDAVNRKSLLKGHALYERPWFLLCGTTKSGKSSLLRGSGLYFPLKYPSEKDGLIIEGANQAQWYFANEAVWIDTPGSFMEENCADDWSALVGALKKVRPVNPVDGVAVVVDTKEVLNTDDQGIKEIAKKLRTRIDDLIAQWGIEFPVYLLFNRTDEVPGFNEYFGEQLERGQDQIFGATLNAKTQQAMPRMAFVEEFNLLVKSLTDLRLDKLGKERVESNKRMICRFVIHFEGIQQKLGALVAELFKPSNYEGKPIFRGFYFTSCYEKLPDLAPNAVPAASGDLSQTVFNHPLNPNRALNKQSPRGPEPSRQAGAGSSKSTGKSVFVLPLFREIMVLDKTLVKSTQKRTRRELIQHYTIVFSVLAVAALVGLWFWNVQSNASRFHREIEEIISQIPSEQSPLMEQYAALDLINKAVVKLQQYEEKGVPLSMGIGYYKGKEMLVELKKSYIYRVKRFIVTPSVKYLEYDIRERSDAYEELAGEAYDSLYRSLKAYLSMSEAAPKDLREVDTVFLGAMIFDGIRKSIMATVNTSRLPVQVETILKDNISLYIRFLVMGEFPRIQENQRLVEVARKRLSKLPSASALYQAVMNKLSVEAPQITLDQVLKRNGEGILHSDATISVLYTQDGWQQFVSDAISDAAKNPFRVDWVIGLTKDELPESMFDTKKLRSDMVNVYLEDFKAQWLGFLGAVQLDPFGDIQRSGRILTKLMGENGELPMLLTTVADYTLLKDESVAEKAGGTALDAASKIKGLNKTVKQIKQVEKTLSAADKFASFSLGNKSPFDTHNAFFDHLRSFVRSTGGSMSGFEGYKDKALTLAEKLAQIQAQGEQQAIVLFNGKESDPLLNGWKHAQSVLSGMPEEMASATRNLLMWPFEYTGLAVSEVLTRTLTTQWKNEIIKPFTSRFSGRYPFFLRGEEASFNDVMDFFRPVTGTYWGFYERVLSSYIIKTEKGWAVRPLGSLKLNFNQDLFASINSAERITNIFFKQDGTFRAMEISMTPAASNKNTASIEIGGQKLDLTPGGKTIRMRWPVEQNPTARLSVIAGQDFTQEVVQNGSWGFLKLLQMARVNKMNNNTFMAKWQISVQNMYMIYIDAKVQIAGSDHPFGEPVFQSFTCPTELLLPMPTATATDTTETVGNK
jgi:type VI secretion system protein ImpL